DRAGDPPTKHLVVNLHPARLPVKRVQLDVPHAQDLRDLPRDRGFARATGADHVDPAHAGRRLCIHIFFAQFERGVHALRRSSSTSAGAGRLHDRHIYLTGAIRMNRYLVVLSGVLLVAGCQESKSSPSKSGGGGGGGNYSSSTPTPTASTSG